MNQLEQKFHQKKAEFEQETAKFTALKAEKEKTEKTISAFQNELKEAIAKTEKGLIASGEISEEEYIDLRNQTTGLKARIEYQQAKLEDLQEKIHQQAEVTQAKQNEAIRARNAVFSQHAKENFQKWLAENKATLNKFFTDFYYSGIFISQENHWKGIFSSSEEQIIEYMMNNIKEIIPYICPIAPNLFINSPLSESDVRTPMQKHKESFDKAPKGFEKLLGNLQ